MALTLTQILNMYEDKNGDEFVIENVSTEDRRAIVNELIESSEWRLDDWIKSSQNMWRIFSSGFSRTISINDGEGEYFGDIVCSY